MTDKDKDRIECAIRHIDSCLDVDPWARDIAIDAMKAQLSEEGTTSDCISRQAAIDAVENCEPGEEPFAIKSLPSAQSERKAGRWTRISIDRYTQHAQAWYRCSECQGEFIGKWNYCPNCGAEMNHDDT